MAQGTGSGAYTTDEVAALLRCSLHTVRRMAARGQLPECQRVGAHRLFPKALIDAVAAGGKWEHGQLVQAAPEAALPPGSERLSPQVAQPEYAAVLRAIERTAHAQGPEVERTVLGCLWLAGVHPSGFVPDHDAR